MLKVEQYIEKVGTATLTDILQATGQDYYSLKLVLERLEDFGVIEIIVSGSKKSVLYRYTRQEKTNKEIMDNEKNKAEEIVHRTSSQNARRR